MHLATFIDPMIDEVKAEAVKNLMKNAKIDFDEAVKLLGLDEFEIKTCKAILEEELESERK